MNMNAQPQLLGFSFRVADDLSAMITDERDDEVFIQSEPFTGWMYQAEFYERIGKDALGYYLAED